MSEPSTDWIAQYEQHASSTDWKPTELSPEEEKRFRSWLVKTDWFNEIKGEIAKENKIDPKKIDNARALEMVLQNADYDYRGAWKSGAVADSRNESDGMLHWPSADNNGKMLKSPKHETAWKEFFMQQHGADPDKLGLDTLDKAKAWQQKRPKTEDVLYPSMRKAGAQ